MLGGADTVAGAMPKVGAIARAADDAACHIIDRASLHALARRQPLAYEGDGGVACLPHHVKDGFMARRNLLARPGESHPRVIGKNGLLARQVRPEIEEDEIAAPDGGGILF